MSEEVLIYVLYNHVIRICQRRLRLSWIWVMCVFLGIIQSLGVYCPLRGRVLGVVVEVLWLGSFGGAQSVQ